MTSSAPPAAAAPPAYAGFSFNTPQSTVTSTQSESAAAPKDSAVDLSTRPDATAGAATESRGGALGFSFNVKKESTAVTSSAAASPFSFTPASQATTSGFSFGSAATGNSSIFGGGAPSGTFTFGSKSTDQPPKMGFSFASNTAAEKSAAGDGGPRTPTPPDVSTTPAATSAVTSAPVFGSVSSSTGGFQFGQSAVTTSATNPSVAPAFSFNLSGAQPTAVASSADGK